MELIKLNEKQWDYWHNANEKLNMKSISADPSQILLDYYLIPRRIHETTEKGSILILGNTRGSIERNVIKPMQEIWGADVVSNISSKNTVQMFGKEVYVLGTSKISNLNFIRGMSVEYCYGYEVEYWTSQFFDMLKSRLNLKESKFDGTFIPRDYSHWLKQSLDNKDGLFFQYHQSDDKAEELIGYNTSEKIEDILESITSLQNKLTK